MLHSSLDDLVMTHDSIINRDAAKSYILSWKWVGGLGGDARPVTHLYMAAKCYKEEGGRRNYGKIVHEGKVLPGGW